MAKRILNKRSSVSGKVPTAQQLEHGEIAINYAAGEEKFYIKNSDNKVISIDARPTVESLSGVSISTTQLNQLSGVTSNVQAQINSAKAQISAMGDAKVSTATTINGQTLDKNVEIKFSGSGVTTVTQSGNTFIIDTPIVKGTQGVDGFRGAQGDKGTNGTQGNQGSNGTNGTQGNQGSQGDIGTTGAAGSKGPQGNRGAAGSKGSQGDQGSQGDIGTTGAAGSKGPQGSRGAAGSKGSQGDQGSQGDIGTTGAAGAAGSKGPQGSRGATGSKGSQGDQGSQGDIGTTGAAGSKGPQGSRGATGSKGSQGDQGSQGDIGTTGAAGSKGPQGTRGPQGTPGSFDDGAYLPLAGGTLTGVVNSNSDIKTSAKMYAANGFFQTSDETLKNFGEDVEVNFEQLRSLPKKYFKWKNNPEKREIGTSAQKVAEIYPEMVSRTEDGKLTVAYDKLAIVALAAIDRLNEKIDKLEEEIRILKK